VDALAIYDTIAQSITPNLVSIEPDTLKMKAHLAGTMLGLAPASSAEQLGHGLINPVYTCSKGTSILQLTPSARNTRSTMPPIS
jgi:hypothetical protein